MLIASWSFLVKISHFLKCILFLGFSPLMAATDSFEKECPFLTTNQGTKVSDDRNTLKVGERGPSLLEDFISREKITHFDHERIPERVVHARGSGAHGYFQVYQPMHAFTKAQFLQDPSIKTPVFVRFSTVAGFRGSADTVRDVRGFATKFYTQEGVFDLVGNNMPVFFIQDGIQFPDVIHAVKPEPHHEMPQASSAHDNFWDFISLTPESMHMVMWVISDRALPRSYSMMEGFGVHTFQFVNAEGQRYFIKFHWKPVKGVYSLLFDETQIIAGRDPDFNRRDLYESIERKDFPEFELGVQILEEKDLNHLEFDFLDPTKIWPEEEVPVKRIGKMTLNRNPDNFFNETEQVAFHPGHIVPGIDFTDDPLLQTRLFSYLDTQLLRLGGPNFHQIPINQTRSALANNQRDGLMRQSNDAGKVNYGPNSLAKGCPVQASWGQGGFVTFPSEIQGKKIRKRPESFGDHYTQATLFWNSMSEAEKRHIIKAFHFELGKVQYPHIRKKMVEHLNHINHSLAVEVAKGIDVAAPDTLPDRPYEKRSPALSLENHKKHSIKGRQVAILAWPGVDLLQVRQYKNWLEQEGAIVSIVSSRLGELQNKNKNGLKIDKTFATTDSALFDAVLVAGAPPSTSDMETDEKVKNFIRQAYRHCKPIAFLDGKTDEENRALLPLNVVKDPDKAHALGIVFAHKNAEDSYKAFKQAIEAHRFWDREKN